MDFPNSDAGSLKRFRTKVSSVVTLTFLRKNGLSWKSMSCAPTTPPVNPSLSIKSLSFPCMSWTMLLRGRTWMTLWKRSFPLKLANPSAAVTEDFP